jgi:hypothetical protein
MPLSTHCPWALSARRRSGVQSGYNAINPFLRLISSTFFSMSHPFFMYFAIRYFWKFNLSEFLLQIVPSDAYFNIETLPIHIRKHRKKIQHFNVLYTYYLWILNIQSNLLFSFGLTCSNFVKLGPLLSERVSSNWQNFNCL